MWILLLNWIVWLVTAILTVILGLTLTPEEARTNWLLRHLPKNRMRLFVWFVSFLTLSGILGFVKDLQGRPVQQVASMSGQTTVRPTLEAVEKEIAAAAEERANEALHAYKAADDLLRKENYREAARGFRTSIERVASKAAYLNLGLSLRGAGEYANAKDAFKRALALPPRSEDSSLLDANATLQLGVMLSMEGSKDALALLQKALQRFIDLEDIVGQAGARYELATHMYQTGDTRGALPHLSEARLQFEDIGSPIGSANVMYLQAIIASDQGEIHKAEQALSDASAQYHAANSKRGEAAVCHQFGMLHDLHCNIPAAMEQYEKSRSLALSAGAKRQAALSINALANLYRERGDVANLRASAQKALELNKAINAADVAGWAHLYLGAADGMENHPDEALKNLEIAQAKFATLDTLGLIETAIEQGRMHLQKGDLAGAAERMNFAISRSAESGYELARASAFHRMADVSLARMDTAGALQFLQSARAIYDNKNAATCESTEVRKKIEQLVATTQASSSAPLATP